MRERVDHREISHTLSHLSLLFPTEAASLELSPAKAARGAGGMGEMEWKFRRSEKQKINPKTEKESGEKKIAL